MHRLLLKHDTPALDTAHIEYVIDERQQMLARRRDLPEIVRDLRRLREIRLRQRRVADDRIHRSADVVRHVEKEIPLRPVRRRFLLHRDLERVVFLLQRLLIRMLRRRFPLPVLLLRVPAKSLHHRKHHAVQDQHRREIRHHRPVNVPRRHVGIEHEVAAMRVHAVVLRATSVEHIRELLRLIRRADPPQHRMTRHIDADHRRIVGRFHDVAPHEQEGTHRVHVVAIQQGLHRQHGFLGECLLRVAIREDDAVASAERVQRHVDEGAVTELHPLHIGLVRRIDETEGRDLRQSVADRFIADAVLRVLRDQTSRRVQQRDARHPERLRILSQLRLARVERTVPLEGMHRR